MLLNFCNSCVRYGFNLTGGDFLDCYFRCFFLLRGEVFLLLGFESSGELTLILTCIDHSNCAAKCLIYVPIFDLKCHILFHTKGND